MFLLDGAATGNVFAYNFATNMNYGGDTAGTGIGTHGAHPLMNLFEGNQMQTRFRMDYTWGTNSDNTLFRNAVTNETSSAYSNLRNVLDLWAYSMYENIIGNVLGTLGTETIYAQTTGPVNSSAEWIYSFGETSSFGTLGADGGDALSTVFRQGNWDSVTNTVRWDEDIVSPNHTLPQSFYLTAKTSYFGNCVWPPVGPDLSPMVTNIPAATRYNGNACAGGAQPTPPASLSVTIH
jgi:hypothetical protein